MRGADKIIVGLSAEGDEQKNVTQLVPIKAARRTKHEDNKNKELLNSWIKQKMPCCGSEGGLPRMILADTR
jgi:hypothetical protein